jgi:TRAP-type C4-dicarboxylate transport system permease small subunit
MSQKLATFFIRLRQFGCRCEDALLCLLLALMLGLGTLQIVQRNLSGGSFVWTDEFLRILVLWLAMIGAVAASRDDRHIVINLLERFLPQRTAQMLRLVLDLFTIGVCLLLAWHCGRFVWMEHEYGSQLLGGLPAWPFQAVMPVAFAIIAYRYSLFFCKRLQQLRRKEVA